MEKFYAGLNSAFVGGCGNGMYGDNLLATASKGTSHLRRLTSMASVLQKNAFFSFSV